MTKAICPYPLRWPYPRGGLRGRPDHRAQEEDYCWPTAEGEAQPRQTQQCPVSRACRKRGARQRTRCWCLSAAWVAVPARRRPR
eukprot:1646895-Pyramimonas_sp.AAC.1